MGGGDLNATFLCGSVVVTVAVVVLTLPVIVFRDGDRTMGSGSERGKVVRVETLRAALLSCERTEGSAARAVCVPEESDDVVDGAGSPMDGNGRCAAISGRGLYDEIEVGVDITRVVGGGHSGRGGNCNIFSFGVVAVVVSSLLLSLGGTTTSRSLSFESPLLKRWNNAFIVVRKVIRWPRGAPGYALMDSQIVGRSTA